MEKRLEGAIRMDEVTLRQEPSEVVEFRTFMRERPVACRWSDGRITGDRELLERIEHMVRDGDWARQPSTVARVISDAVAHPVTIRLVSEAGTGDDQVLSELGAAGSDSPPCCDGALGDYWLG